MKILLLGANGTVGKAVHSVLKTAGHEVVTAGRSSGDYLVNMEESESVYSLFRQLGDLDAVAITAGEVAFKPLSSLTKENFEDSLRSKFLGQVSCVQAGISHVKDGGSFTLISGVTARESIRDGVAAAAVSRAIEGFVMAAATELPRGQRINVVSPTVLEESLAAYGDYFAGHEPVSGNRVGNAFLKAITGRMTGQTIIP
jgi:NAD(P)-dependent dehydrogenase (short-subunit alcohol dehydrogenase family)